MNKMKRILETYIESFYTLIWLLIHKSTQEYILVGSHALNEGGASLVLLDAIDVLKNRGKRIVVASPDYGILVKRLREKGITTLSCQRFINIFEKLLLSKSWNAALINTIVLYEWVERLSRNRISVYWWIHEGKTYADQYKNYIHRFDSKYVKISCVSEWSKMCMQEAGIFVNSEIIYYGVKDSAQRYDSKTRSDKLRLLMVGAICKRKGQLELLSAINRLPKNLLKTIEVIFIGSMLNGANDYYNKFLQQVKEYSSSVIYKKYVPHEQMNEYYDNSDVVVCCSLDDPLPVVVTEALMNSKCILTSTHTGQAKIIANGVNGFIFEAGNTEELSQKIEQLVNNRSKLEYIGKGGRMLYEKHFSLMDFENNFARSFNDFLSETNL